MKHLEARLASENERLSHEWTGAGKIPPAITTEIVEQLTPQARAIEATEQMVAAAKHELEIHRTGENEIRSQIESAITGGEKLGLPKDVEAAGDLVAQLVAGSKSTTGLPRPASRPRRCRNKATIWSMSKSFRSSCSWLLALFVLGFVFAGAWWYLAEIATGQIWRLDRAGWGRRLVIACLIKFFVEESAADRFDACHRQIERRGEQIEAAEAEQRKLDPELPVTSGLGFAAAATRRAASGRA